MSWPDRSHHLWLVWLTLAWATFFLWSFVFGWHSRYTGGRVFSLSREPKLWITATLCGLSGSLVLHLFIDPSLRTAAPKDYPESVSAWLAMTLFVLAFDQLFLCFAPIAFFGRLARNPRIAGTLTVLFGIFLVVLKLKSGVVRLPADFVAGLLAWRILAGGLSVYFYLRGGTWLTWWWILGLQLRHLIDLI